MKKFAYILMGSSYDPSLHNAEFQPTANHLDCIFTVRNFAEAKELVLRLVEEGFGALEICGAFGRERALELIVLTDGKIPISYSVHEPEQNALSAAFFGG